MTIRQLASDEDGTALIEGAIVVPFLMVLILGILEFAHIFYDQHLVSTGVRDAAHYLARRHDPTSSAAQATAQNLASSGSPTGTSYRRVTGFDPGNVTFGYSYIANALNGTSRTYAEAAVACGGPDQIMIITATGSYSYSSLGFLGFLGMRTPTLTVRHSERCIGQS